MKKLRQHSCDMTVSCGGRVFEWVLIVRGGNYTEVAALAEQHVANDYPNALIDEMNIQAQGVVEEGGPSIYYAGEPREIVRQTQRFALFRWLGGLRSNLH